MIRSNHLKLIAQHSVRHGIRGGAGLMSIFITLLLGLILASVMIAPLDGLDQRMDTLGNTLTAEQRTEVIAGVHAEVIKVAGKAINWVMEPSPEQLAYLTRDKPAMVSAILVMLFLVTPLLTCLGSFNQTSGDIGSRGLRFLLIRTERPNIFLGRFIGTFLFTAFVNLLLFTILAVYMALRIKVHPAADQVLWLAQGYLRMLVFALPYVAVCAWVSCSMGSSFASLALSVSLVYVVPLFIGRVAAALSDSISYAQFITPWGFKYWLLEPAGAKLFGGVAAMLAFTAVFLALGMRHFGKRDL
ncbi:MAG: hypothetical protein WKG01_38600 [Kofleriaceae bacterium]